MTPEVGDLQQAGREGVCEGPWTKEIKAQRPRLVSRALVNFRGAAAIGRVPRERWNRPVPCTRTDKPRALPLPALPALTVGSSSRHRLPSLGCRVGQAWAWGLNTEFSS